MPVPVTEFSWESPAGGQTATEREAKNSECAGRVLVLTACRSASRVLSLWAPTRISFQHLHHSGASLREGLLELLELNAWSVS